MKLETTVPSAASSRLIRLHQPQQQTQPWILPFSRKMLQGSKRRLVCFANSQRPNEDAPLRAEIAPSVLRSLQPPEPNSTSNPSGESLIERNLRKRAMAEQASSEAHHLSPSPDGETEILIEKNSMASSSEPGFSSSFTGNIEMASSPVINYDNHKNSASLRTEQSSAAPSSGGLQSELFSRYAMPSLCPITTAFWQELPTDFSMEGFHNLDFLAMLFRLSVVLHLSLSSELYGLPFSAIVMLHPWTGMLLEAFNPKEEDRSGKTLAHQWRKDVSKDLGKLIDNKEVLYGTIEFFCKFCNPQYWTSRVMSGKAMDLSLVLSYSTYVSILSEGDTSLKKKLEECSASLGQAIAQLHGPLLDPISIWEKVLKGTPFTFDGRVFVYEHALIFPCKLPMPSGCIELGFALDEVQQCLDKELNGLDLVAMLRRSADNQRGYFLVIAPWYWILPLKSPEFTPPMPILLVLLSCVGTAQFAAAGLDFGFAWEPYGVPLGWAAIIAAVFYARNMQLPAVCPFPSLGALGRFSSDLGNLPSRQCLVGTLLKGSLTSLAVSLLLLAFGSTFWGPGQYNSASVIDFHGYILVPPGLFSYSGILTKLLESVSVAKVTGEDGVLKLAASPFALAGLLGLNFTAFSLFPGLRTDGTYVLRGLLKDKRLANRITLAFTTMLVLSLMAQNPALGLGWLLAVCFPTETECVVKDEVSDPYLLTSLAGIVLVASATACFIPLPQ